MLILPTLSALLLLTGSEQWEADAESGKNLCDMQEKTLFGETCERFIAIAWRLRDDADLSTAFIALEEIARKVKLRIEEDKSLASGQILLGLCLVRHEEILSPLNRQCTSNPSRICYPLGVLQDVLQCKEISEALEALGVLINYCDDKG